jgi:hypothetical protein
MAAPMQARAGMLNEVMFADQLSVSRAMDRWVVPDRSTGHCAHSVPLTCALQILGVLLAFRLSW